MTHICGIKKKKPSRIHTIKRKVRYDTFREKDKRTAEWKKNKMIKIKCSKEYAEGDSENWMNQNRVDRRGVYTIHVENDKLNVTALSPLSLSHIRCVVYLVFDTCALRRYTTLQLHGHTANIFFFFSWQNNVKTKKMMNEFFGRS